MGLSTFLVQRVAEVAKAWNNEFDRMRATGQQSRISRRIEILDDHSLDEEIVSWNLKLKS